MIGFRTSKRIDAIGGPAAVGRRKSFPSTAPCYAERYKGNFSDVRRESQMDRIAWETVRAEFAFDGSWRDIYVLGTNIATWERMLDGIRAKGYNLKYSRDNRPAELPAHVAQVFAIRSESSPLLSVEFEGVLANCHFFAPGEIEFDIDPREVRGQERLDALIGFMHCLAEAVGKEVLQREDRSPRGRLE